MVNEFGKIAYDAYCKSVGGKSVRGEDLPSWEQQSDALRAAWTAAASAVIDEITA